MPNISMDKKYQTRDGRPVRILCVDAPAAFPVVGIAEETVHRWNADGTCRAAGAVHFDLVEAPDQLHIKGWIVSREILQVPNDYRWFHTFCEEQELVDYYLRRHDVRRSVVTSIDMKVDISDIGE